MIKRILAGSCLLLGTYSSFAQNPCGTDESHKHMMSQNQEYAESVKQFQNNWNLYKKDIKQTEVKQGKAAAPKYIIPVVVHVFFGANTGNENISDAQIKSEIAFLNKSFRNIPADTARRRAGVFGPNDSAFDFKALAADAEIEFRLAKKDPMGNCTNGIIRYQTNNAYNGNEELKKKSVWDTKSYFNIWVVGAINRGVGGGVAGYAQFPFAGGVSLSALTDGIMVIHNEFGNIGTSNPGQTPTVSTSTHEAGHWFGLYHTFQGDSCSLENDGVDDTPPTFKWQEGLRPANPAKICTAYPCANANLQDVWTPNTCSTESTDMPDMIENYMDYYIGDSASNMFTKQQVARMHFVLDRYRKKLYAPENLVKTGVLDPESPCTLIPKFGITFSNTNTTSYDYTVCANTAVNFVDLSYNGTAGTTFNWNFGDGATPQTSNVKNPTNVIYSTPGKKTVTLTITNAAGEATGTFTNAITVTPSSATLNRSIYFPDYPTTEEGWTLTNEGGVNWQVSSIGVYEGTASLKLPGSNSNMHGSSYTIVSPSYDFTSGNAPYFEFKYAFGLNALGSYTSTDRMLVQASLNCGLTWGNLRPEISGTALQTTTAALNPSVNFIPVNQSQWKTVSVNIPSLYKTSNTKLRILFQSGTGNNLYIDDIRFGQNTGISELNAKEIDLSIFPNPFSSSTNIRYKLTKAENVLVEVYDILGKKVATLADGKQAEGEQSVTFSKEVTGSTPGMYFVKLTIAGSTLTQKVMLR